MEMVVVIAVFVIMLFLVEVAYYTYATMRNPGVKRVRKRLKTLPTVNHDVGPVDIVRRRSLSDIPWFNRLLHGTPSLRKLDKLLVQANIEHPLGIFILWSVLMFAVGYLFSRPLLGSTIFSIIVALLMGSFPYLTVLSKKRRRMNKFQRQLPDALDLVARALKAGHAFSSGMKMVADEFDDPIGPEFERTMDEINFGVSVADALKNLTNRVDCADLKFFVVSVIIQRETGGNLADIIEGIAHLVRERFKLLGRIKALSAEARFSAIILVALPFLLALALFFVSRDYIVTLTEDPIGKMMIYIAIVMMALGIFIMRNMIRIKV